jgi:hypothetical protein
MATGGRKCFDAAKIFAPLVPSARHIGQRDTLGTAPVEKLKTAIGRSTWMRRTHPTAIIGPGAARQSATSHIQPTRVMRLDKS